MHKFIKSKKVYHDSRNNIFRKLSRPLCAQHSAPWARAMQMIPRLLFRRLEREISHESRTARTDWGARRSGHRKCRTIREAAPRSVSWRHRIRARCWRQAIRCAAFTSECAHSGRSRQRPWVRFPSQGRHLEIACSVGTWPISVRLAGSRRAEQMKRLAEVCLKDDDQIETMQLKGDYLKSENIFKLSSVGWKFGLVK